MINARSETVISMPAFMNAFKKRRCRIPANGFYEWQGPKGAKPPMYITLPDEMPFEFAGLWDIWDDKGDAEQPLFSCAILTTGASPAIETIHRWMPIILTPDAYQGWLDEDTPDSVLKEVLDTQTHKNFAFRPVSKAVNSAKRNSADLIRRDKTAG